MMTPAMTERGLRSILVALDGSPWSQTATTLALDWATRFDASLVGLGVVDEPSIDRGEPVPMGAYAYKKHRDETRLVDAHGRVLVLLEEFRARAAALGRPSLVLEDIGDPAERILREAQRCDVVILGRETHFRFETQDRPDMTLAQVLRVSPRPVVIVPRELPGDGPVIIAYGGGREAARTLQTFQSLGIVGDAQLHIVTVHRELAEAQEIAGLAGEFLTAHDTRHRLWPIASGAPPADVLLEEIRLRRPRLVVIGAHSYHPLRDLFATSVTRAVLRNCPAPVFVGS
jgi:nucleotide-binding universal stress UspA family protein